MSTRIFIIDTNVVAAGLITSESNSSTTRVLDAMLNGSLFYLLSADLLREYRNVLLRPRIARLHGFNEPEIDQILTEITANAIWREPPSDTDQQHQIQFGPTVSRPEIPLPRVAAIHLDNHFNSKSLP